MITIFAAKDENLEEVDPIPHLRIAGHFNSSLLLRSHSHNRRRRRRTRLPLFPALQCLLHLGQTPNDRNTANAM